MATIATRPWAGYFGIKIPPEEKDFSLLQNIQTGSRAHPASCAMGTGVLSRG